MRPESGFPLSDETPAAAKPRRPWWPPTRRDLIVVLILAVAIGWLNWPREPPGPVDLLHRGTVGGVHWSVLGQRAGSDAACLQVRAGGARRALMCDQHWDRDVHRLWHGAPPPSAGSTIGAPSLLRVRFPGTDQVLMVSVLYDEIAEFRTGSGEVVLRTTPLYDTDFHYVVGTLTAAQSTDLRAFAADGEPLYYHYVDPLPD
jgi:hypothetical protein